MGEVMNLIRNEKRLLSRIFLSNFGLLSKSYKYLLCAWFRDLVLHVGAYVRWCTQK
jgi:hypothetical protein